MNLFGGFKCGVFVGISRIEYEHIAFGAFLRAAEVSAATGNLIDALSSSSSVYLVLYMISVERSRIVLWLGLRRASGLTACRQPPQRFGRPHSLHIQYQWTGRGHRHRMLIRIDSHGHCLVPDSPQSP